MTAAPRILVVDDSPTIRRVVESALVGAGYAGLVCDDPLSVVEEARATTPDLIVMDQVMPAQDGLSAAAALGEDAIVANIPILLMCSQDVPPPGELAPLGIVATVQKPFAPEALLSKVEEVLEKHGTLGRDETLPMVRPLQIPTTTGQLPPDPQAAAGAEEQAPASDLASLGDDETERLSAPPFSVPQTIKSGVSPSSSADAAAEAEAGAAPSPVSLDVTDPAAAFAALAGGATQSAVESLLCTALLEAGVDGASGLAATVSTTVAQALPAEVMGTFVRAALGVDGFDDPLPALYGDLASVSLGEILELLAGQAAPCVVELSADDRRYGLTLCEGAITHVEGRTVPSALLLMRPLVDAGVVEEQAARDLLADEAEAAAELGRRLVESGALHAERLAQALPDQVSLLLSEVLRARSGVFAVDLAPAAPVTAPRGFGVPVAAALEEAAKMIDEAALPQDPADDEETA